MTAFSYGVASAIRNNIRTLYFRRRLVGSMELSHDEFLQLFVPSQDHELFKAIAPLAATQPYMWHRLPIHSPDRGQINAMATFAETTGSPAPPAPRRPVVQPDAPDELRARFNSWLDNGADVSRDYGRVLKVFELLNEHCSKQAMRYYWPSIIMLCSETDDTKKYATDLQELKMPASPKPLPAGLLQACRKTAETLSIVQLMDKNFQGVSKERAPVTIEIVTGQQYEEPVGKFHGLT